jgi:hypothetical protein
MNCRWGFSILLSPTLAEITTQPKCRNQFDITLKSEENGVPSVCYMLKKMSFLSEYLIDKHFLTRKHKMLKEKILIKRTLWFQSAKRTIPTERPPFVGEVSAHRKF